MPEIPEEAVNAAVEAVMERLAGSSGRSRAWGELIVRDALEAAAPVLAEAVAKKILAHMDAHGPVEGFNGSLGSTLRRAWRRHFSIAARVAAFAFSTEEDKKRTAAEALARGDFTACAVPDPGKDER